MNSPVLVLFGPTAVGKTAILRKLACSFDGERLSGARTSFPLEIISADSMQVYRGMDIGTAKPSSAERAVIPHHLVDIKNPDEQFNAGEFVRLANDAIFSAASRGALPVVSGGTGFYLKNLVLGLSGAPPSDLALRASLIDELASRGASSLMEELASVDPVSAARIHINDKYRLVRALEVYRLTGKPLSDFAMNDAAPSDKFELNSGKKRFILVGLEREREDLYRRINARASKMFAEGLSAEVRRLFEAGYTPDNPGLRAIGYREFFVRDFDESGNFWRLSEDLAGVQALIAQNSRRYAKRQITFFSALADVNWIQCGDSDDESAAKVMAVLSRQ